MRSTVVSFITAFVLAGLGIAVAYYSELDDAPGGILIGMLLVIGAVVIAARAIKRTRFPHPPT